MFQFPARLLTAALLTTTAATATYAAVDATSSPGASNFVAIAPCRRLDTRPGGVKLNTSRAQVPLGALETITVQMRGTNGECTIPDTATAVVANITTLNGTAASHLRAWPYGETIPNSSINNWSGGQGPTPNLAIIPLNTTGKDSPGLRGNFSLRNQNGTVDVIVDIQGFYEEDLGSAVTAATAAPTTTTGPTTTTAPTTTTVPDTIPQIVQGGGQMSSDIPIPPLDTDPTKYYNKRSFGTTALGVGTVVAEFDTELGNVGTTAVTVFCRMSLLDPTPPFYIGRSVFLAPGERKPVHLTQVGHYFNDYDVTSRGTLGTTVTCTTTTAAGEVYLSGTSYHWQWVKA